jgi:hypothetical protein
MSASTAHEIGIVRQKKHYLRPAFSRAKRGTVTRRPIFQRMHRYGELHSANPDSLVACSRSRITTFGLADVRGAAHAGFDEGALVQQLRSRANESEQVGIDYVCICRAHAVWIARIDFKRAVLE